MGRKLQNFGMIITNMRIFKIIFGLIVMVIGAGMASAGCALFAYGSFEPMLNVFFGFTLTFLGLVLRCRAFIFCGAIV
jgi:hypothetical protein